MKADLPSREVRERSERRLRRVVPPGEDYYFS